MSLLMAGLWQPMHQSGEQRRVKRVKYADRRSISATASWSRVIHDEIAERCAMRLLISHWRRLISGIRCRCDAEEDRIRLTSSTMRGAESARSPRRRRALNISTRRLSLCRCDVSVI